MKKKLTAIFLCVALAAIAIVGASLAYFTDTKSATNTFTRIDPLAPNEMTYWNVWGTIHKDTTVTSAQSEALFGENGPYPNGVFPVLVEADAIQAEGFADASAAWTAFDAQA